MLKNQFLVANHFLPTSLLQTGIIYTDTPINGVRPSPFPPPRVQAVSTSTSGGNDVTTTSTTYARRHSHDASLPHSAPVHNHVTLSLQADLNMTESMISLVERGSPANAWMASNSQESLSANGNSRIAL